MTPADTEDAVIADLFYEQDVDILAPNYRHGLLRSLLVLVRTLFLSRSAVPARGAIVSGSTVAVTFFPNEYHAAAQASERVGIDHLIALNVHALALVRRELGLAGTLREIASFVPRALRLKGRGYIGRLTYPLLGWLLYRAFRSMLAGKQSVTLVTTNTPHPLSIAISWAAVHSGQESVYVEHATTTAVAFRNRGYHRCYVQFPHTRQLLIDMGMPSANVHALRDLKIGPPPAGSTIRTVGVCINVFDSLESIADITQVLLARGLKPIYRVHDADPRLARLKQLAASHGIEFDSARASRIEAFLMRVDLIVAGNSNVIADALIAAKPVIYYWDRAGMASMLDYYGFTAYYKLPSARDKAGLDTALAGLGA